MPKLLTRLTNQLRSRGVQNAKDTAKGLLQKRGHMSGDELTPEGKKRQSLGNKGRALDRAAKYGGGKPSDYKYNSKTNRTRKK